MLPLDNPDKYILRAEEIPLPEHWHILELGAEIKAIKSQG